MTISALPRIRVKAVSRRYVPQVIPFAPMVDADLIELLADYAALAASGEIDGIAMAATSPNGSIRTSYLRGDSLFTLVAAVKTVDARLMREVEGM